MAILNFGQTFRTSYTGFALTNNSTQVLVISALNGVPLNPGATKFFALDVFDAYTRAPRHPQVDDVKLTAAGVGVYVDDFAYLCSLIKAGTVLLKTTTYLASSNTFTAGATAAFTAAGTSIFLA